MYFITAIEKQIRNDVKHTLEKRQHLQQMVLEKPDVQMDQNHNVIGESLKLIDEKVGSTL